MTSRDPRDAILLQCCPIHPAPVFGSPELLDEPGRRLWACADGLYLEVRSPVLHWLLLVAQVPMPYGRLSPFVRLLNGAIPSTLMQDIAQQSLAASPSEVAFGIQWTDSGYELIVPPVLSCDANHVAYRDTFDPARLVLDIHSHGQHAAYFSPTDDASDSSRIGPYLAAVIGPRYPLADSELALRAVCAPYLIPLPAEALSVVVK